MTVETEYWTTLSRGDRREGAGPEARLEAEGWEGVVMYDSQCMFPEAWTYRLMCSGDDQHQARHRNDKSDHSASISDRSCGGLTPTHLRRDSPLWRMRRSFLATRRPTC